MRFLSVKSWVFVQRDEARLCMTGDLAAEEEHFMQSF